MPCAVGARPIFLIELEKLLLLAEVVNVIDSYYCSALQVVRFNRITKGNRSHREVDISVVASLRAIEL